jgi:hypothetical protein
MVAQANTGLQRFRSVQRGGITVICQPMSASILLLRQGAYHKGEKDRPKLIFPKVTATTI